MLPGVVQLSVGLPELPDSFNPHVPSADNRLSVQLGQILSEVFPSPFILGGDDQWVLNTSVAESAQLLSTAPETVVYKLRPGLNWSNGEPVTASDFWALWKAEEQLPPGTAGSAGYRDIESINGAGLGAPPVPVLSQDGGEKVTVVFATPYQYWEGLFDDILPLSYLSDHSFVTGFDSVSPGLSFEGPYRVTSFKPGVGLDLATNPEWTGPAPQLSRVSFFADQSDFHLYQDLSSGRAQMVFLSRPSSTEAQLAHEVPNAHSAPSGAYQLEQLMFNLHSTAVSSLQVRQALSDLLDREQLLMGAMGNWASHQGPSGNRLVSPGTPGYQSDDQGYRQPHVHQAEKLMDQAGWTLGPNGFFESQGLALSVRLLAMDSGADAEIARAVANQWIVQGCQVTLELEPASSYWHDLATGNFDVALEPTLMGPDPASAAQYFQTAPSGAQTNTEDATGLVDPSLDDEFASAEGNLSLLASASLYDQADTYLWQQMISLPLFVVPGYLAYTMPLQGVLRGAGSFGPFQDIAQWTVEPLNVAGGLDAKGARGGKPRPSKRSG